jgi:hypothetical protein
MTKSNYPMIAKSEWNPGLYSFVIPYGDHTDNRSTGRMIHDNMMWREISIPQYSYMYTSPVGANNRITMDNNFFNTFDVTLGLGVRLFMIPSNQWRWFVVGGTNWSSYIDLAGPDVSSTDFALMFLAKWVMTKVIHIHFPGQWANSTGSNILASQVAPYYWGDTQAYLARIQWRANSTSNNAYFRINKNGNNCHGSALQALGSYQSTTNTITHAYADFNFGDELQVQCTTAGNSSDVNLGITLTFIKSWDG